MTVTIDCPAIWLRMRLYSELAHKHAVTPLAIFPLQTARQDLKLKERISAAALGDNVIEENMVVIKGTREELLIIDLKAFTAGEDPVVYREELLPAGAPMQKKIELLLS